MINIERIPIDNHDQFAKGLVSVKVNGILITNEMSKDLSPEMAATISHIIGAEKAVNNYLKAIRRYENR